MAVLSWQACSAIPALPILFFLSRSAFPVPLILFCLSSSICPVLHVLFSLFYSACSLLPVLSWLSSMYINARAQKEKLTLPSQNGHTQQLYCFVTVPFYDSSVLLLVQFCDAAVV
jgi:hypothetical protein